MDAIVYAQDAFMLHARIGPVVVTNVLRTHDEGSFELYLGGLSRELTERPSDARVAVLYHVPNGGTWSATQRTRINQVLDRHMSKRKRTTSVWILCTPSPATRGVVTAMAWLSKPPYEYGTEPTLDAALATIQRHHPELDRRDFEQTLQRALTPARHSWSG